MGRNSNMKVIRSTEITITQTSDFKIGDQIKVGKYTATCQKVVKKNGTAWFCFDQYLDEARPMNFSNRNYVGYDESDLRAWLCEHADSILDSWKDRVVPVENGDLLRIPYAEEFFGDISDYEPSGHKQWKLMKDRRNRIASRKGDEYEWGWLQNKVKWSAASFAIVYTDGYASGYYASGSLGVRPVFCIG